MNHGRHFPAASTWPLRRADAGLRSCLKGSRCARQEGQEGGEGAQEVRISPVGEFKAILGEEGQEDEQTQLFRRTEVEKEKEAQKERERHLEHQLLFKQQQQQQLIKIQAAAAAAAAPRAAAQAAVGTVVGAATATAATTPKDETADSSRSWRSSRG